MATRISVSVELSISPEKAWDYWTKPEHITNWNFASDDWCCPRAANDLRVGGILSSRMEAKDGSFGFDFAGTYTVVEPLQRLVFTLGEERVVDVTFSATANGTRIEESFDSEPTHSEEQQREGWQSILNNYKRYAESLG